MHYFEKNVFRDLPSEVGFEYANNLQTFLELARKKRENARFPSQGAFFRATERLDLFDAFWNHGFGDGDSRFAFDAIREVEGIFEKFGYETQTNSSSHNEYIESWKKKGTDTWHQVDEPFRETIPEEVFKAIKEANDTEYVYWTVEEDK
jgi:hypothetical protein